MPLGGRRLNIVTFNCGSSSLNYKVFAAVARDTLDVVCSGKAHRVGVQGSEPSFIQHNTNGETDKQVIPIQNHRQAAVLILQHLKSRSVHVDAAGHRFVHGGKIFQKTTLLTEKNLPELEACFPLAPIHNPNSMSVIDECRRELPGVPQYLTFDTAFHASLPPAAYRYALPEDLVKKYNLRRYGFHGLSYQYVTQAAAQYLASSPADLRIIACHLGTGGSSVAAIAAGLSIDTSMGFSPLSGLMMSTRTGDLDPYLPVYMLGNLGEPPEKLAALYNKKSGLLGISGFSSDIRDIEQAAERGDGKARLAFEMYTYRIRKTIGAAGNLDTQSIQARHLLLTQIVKAVGSGMAALGGVDAIVFGCENVAPWLGFIEEICHRLEFAGVMPVDAYRTVEVGRWLGEIPGLGSLV